RAEVIIPVFEEVVFFHLVQQDGWRSIGFGKNKAVQRRGDDQFGGGDLIDEVLPVVGQRREHRISHFYVFVDRFPVGDNDEVRSDIRHVRMVEQRKEDGGIAVNLRDGVPDFLELLACERPPYGTDIQTEVCLCKFFRHVFKQEAAPINHGVGRQQLDDGADESNAYCTAFGLG